MREPFDPPAEEPPPAPPPTETPPPTPAPVPETPPDKGHDPNPAPPPGDTGAPDAPTPGPAPAPPDPEAPRNGPRSGIDRGHKMGKSGLSGMRGWRTWWELNRDSIVGVRHMLHRTATVTGAVDGDARPDPLGAKRADVLRRLRRVAGDVDQSATVRRFALVALGRMGTDADTTLFIHVLRNQHEPMEVLAAAALGLGLIEIQDATVRKDVRSHLEYFLSRRDTLPAKVRHVLLLSVGRQGRTDKTLVMHLAKEMAGKGVTASDEAAALGFAAGLTGDRMLVPELLHGVRKRDVGGAKVDDVGRSHVILGLGRTGDANSVRTLVQVLKGRRTGLHSRRSAALALGRLLREGGIPAAQDTAVRNALTTVLRKHKDATLRGFAALALCGAREPTGAALCMDALKGGGAADAKPYLALALGLAARNTPDATQARRIRTFLATQLPKTRENEIQAATCVALGLARATEALPSLLDIVEASHRPTAVRGAAANAAGLLGRGNARAERVLTKAMRSSNADLVPEAAIGLGFLGRRSSAPALIAMMRKADSARARGRIVRALAFLGHGSAVDPLLSLLGSRHATNMSRADAAIALGLLGDSREVDPLYEMATDFNYLGSTAATFEMLFQT